MQLVSCTLVKHFHSLLAKTLCLVLAGPARLSDCSHSTCVLCRGQLHSLHYATMPENGSLCRNPSRPVQRSSTLTFKLFCCAGEAANRSW